MAFLVRPRHIFEAVEDDNQTAIELFIEKKYVSLKNHDALDQTVAHVAVKRGNKSILKYLLDKDKYLVTARDKDNCTILHRAAEYGALHLVKYLIEEYKMDPYEPVEERFRNTALHLAALEGKLDVVKYFIEEKNMNANLKNAAQRSPIFVAAFKKHFPIIQYLIECQKVDATGVDDKNENILFPLVIKGDIQSVKYLLDDRKVNLDVNWRGHAGKTLVHWATQMKRTNLISYFVEEKKVDLNIKDDNGWTALHFAASAGNLKSTKYLIEHKANFRIKNAENNTPADICTNFHTKNYLVGISQYRGNPRPRVGRNALYSVSSVERLPPIASPQLTSNTEGTHLTMNQRSESSINNVDQYIQLDTFLVVARVILWLFGSHRRKNSLISQDQLLQKQIDVIPKAVKDAHAGDLKE